jgi:hypothetical protein
MYKPYLLVTFDLWQSIQLIEETSNICVEIDFKNIKQKFQHMIDAQIFQHIIKYKLPSSFKVVLDDINHNLQDLLIWNVSFKKKL